MYTAYSRNVTSLIKHFGCYWPAEGAAVVHLGFHVLADRAQLLQAPVQLHGALDYTPVFLWYDCGPGGTQSPLCLQVKELNIPKWQSSVKVLYHYLTRTEKITFKCCLCEKKRQTCSWISMMKIMFIVLLTIHFSSCDSIFIEAL